MYDNRRMVQFYKDRGNGTIVQGQREGYNCIGTEGRVQLYKDRANGINVR